MSIWDAFGSVVLINLICFVVLIGWGIAPGALLRFSLGISSD